jgi:hypothetical protein
MRVYSTEEFPTEQEIDAQRRLLAQLDTHLACVW